MERDEMEEKYSRYIGMVYRTAFAYFKNKADAEDVSSEVFIKYFTMHPEFENEQHEKAWLMRVTINRCRDILRSFRIKNTVPLEEAGDICTTEDERAVYSAVMALPKKYRLVIHLYYYEGYSTGEIAEISQEKSQTIRTRLSRARKMLKKSLGEELCI
ncbi:MAG: sigma-70 family RNA polymerase sigma factor [Porcipelethomonas sp.]